MPHLTFSRRDSYITYNPLNFLSIYKYCDGVLTDRVHAGVAGLSFGKPARVLKVDRRFELFSKAPLTVVNGVFTLDKERLHQEYQRHCDWLRTDFAGSIGTGS
ncbi:polysaccharide pyruvyl transferase family protein [Mesorhizobium sp. M0898]|uniref:polysaccharide pyruvyl transferase family protein n=1 Tax=Mesorhizobium sp. M0898 TaxID=2957020 RepID=UPI0033394E99